MDQTAQALLADLQAGAQSLPATVRSLTSLVSKDYPGLREVNEVGAGLARKQAALLVGEISATKKKNVASLVARALDFGWSDATLARKIAEVVGLDTRYAQAVENFHQGRIKAGAPKGKAAREAAAYASRLRRHRAGVIARNEVQTVLLAAQRLLWAQQQQDGDVSRYAVRVTRLHQDEKLCNQCRKENGRRRSLKVTTGGPPFHPACRCWEELEDQGVVKTDPALWGDGPVEITKVDRVRTAAGSRRFHLPLGSPIVAHKLPNQFSRSGPGHQMPSFKGNALRELPPVDINHPDYAAWQASEGRNQLAQIAASYEDPMLRAFAQGYLDMGDRYPQIGMLLGDVDVLFHTERGAAYAEMVGEWDSPKMRLRINAGAMGMRDEEPDFVLTENRYGVGDVAGDNEDWSRATAYHEFGHLAHAFMVAQFYYDRPGLQPISLYQSMEIADNDTKNLMGFVPPPISRYAVKGGGVEAVAEYWSFLMLYEPSPELPWWQPWDKYLNRTALKGYPGPKGEGMIRKIEPMVWTDRFDAPSVADEYVRSRREARSQIAKAKGRLDWSPKKNWVENAGGLPRYIEDIALALIRDHGYKRERAIPVAINRVKMWAVGGGGVKPDTQAKAAKAVAEWEALKAKNKAKGVSKHLPGLHDQKDHGRAKFGVGELRKAAFSQFSGAFEAAFDGSPHTNHVTHRTSAEARGMTFYLANGGKTGIGVKDHGDGRIEGTALFNIGPKHAGSKALLAAVENNGVNYVECYGPRLNKNYAKLGFEVVSRSSWNDDYAPNGWDYQTFNHPDYYTMTWKGTPVVSKDAGSDDAETARLDAIWEEACAEAEAEMTPEQRKFAAAGRAADEMQV